MDMRILEEMNWKGRGYYAPRNTKAIQASVEWITWYWVEGETNEERSRDARGCGAGTPRWFEKKPDFAA